MNAMQELRLHADALANAVEQDQKFFAAVSGYVRRLKDISTFPSADLSPAELRIIGERLQSFWQTWQSSVSYAGPNQTENTKDTVREIVRLTQQLGKASADEIRLQFPQIDASGAGSAGKAVFVGHGRSRLWARVQLFLEQELQLQVVTFETETRVGESIVPVLETMLAQAAFAVLVLTAEDETADGSKRARQNVVHEAGLFQGRLGFRRAVLLVQDGLEEFTNVAGLQHIRFSGDNVEQSFYELQRVLRREQLA